MVGTALLLFLRALGGDHRAIVRAGAALSVQALLRFICILLFPRCSPREGHYTFGIVLALPCALCADVVAVRVLALLSGNAPNHALRSRFAG